MEQDKSNRFINSEIEEEEIEVVAVDENSWNDRRQDSQNPSESGDTVDSKEVTHDVDFQENGKKWLKEEGLEGQELKSENLREKESVEVNSEDEIECLEEENFGNSTASLPDNSEKPWEEKHQTSESQDEHMPLENEQFAHWLNTNRTQGKEGRTFGEERYAVVLEKESRNLHFEENVDERPTGSENSFEKKIRLAVGGIDVKQPLTAGNELSDNGDNQAAEAGSETEKDGATFFRDSEYNENEGKSEGREVLAKFEEKEAISHNSIPIILNVTDTEFLLVPFKPSEEFSVDLSHLVTLYDSYDIIDSSVENLFCAIRSNIDLSELVSLDSNNELVLVIPTLNNLYITEDNVYTHEILIRDFLNSFLFLKKNSELLGEELPFISLSLHLKTKDRFITRFNELTRTVREGKGFGALLGSSRLPDQYHQEHSPVSHSKLKRGLSNGAEEEGNKRLKTDI